MAKFSQRRRLTHGLFGRVRRQKKLLAWLTAQSARLASSATADTFVAIVAYATEILTLAANAVGSVAATDTLTFALNSTDGDTVTIDTKTYTLEDSLTNFDGNVQIGTLATDTLDNLIAAMDLSGVAGTDYALAMTAHATVNGAAGAGDTMDVEAKVRGTAANSFVTTEVGAQSSWGGAGTMSGGVDGDTVTLGAQTYTFNAATLVDSPDEVLVGAAATDSIDNLIAAVNNAAGEGSEYGTGTAANASVGAAAGAGDTMDVIALVAGTGGNSIVSTETGANLSFGDTTLSGGVTDNGVTATTHGVSDREGPYNLTTTGALPTPLVTGRQYWAIRIDADTLEWTDVRDGPAIVLTAPGNGTQTLTKGVDNEAMHSLQKVHKPETILAATDIDDLN